MSAIALSERQAPLLTHSSSDTLERSFRAFLIHSIKPTGGRTSPSWKMVLMCAGSRALVSLLRGPSLGALFVSVLSLLE